MFDIKGKQLLKDDRILYSTTHGTLQIGRVLEVTQEGYLKVIGKGNKRELTVKEPNKQVYLIASGYYERVKKRAAWLNKNPQWRVFLCLTFLALVVTLYLMLLTHLHTASTNNHALLIHAQIQF